MLTNAFRVYVASTGSFMNQTALRYFVAVAKAGSIREGAETLRIAQSAISRQIMGLEQELGVKLLDRKPRGIELTVAGEMFLRFAKDGLAQLGRMRRELDELKELRSGSVRLAATESFAHRLLPQCVVKFLGVHPGVHVEILVSDGPGVVQSVQVGDAALGLAFNVEEDDVCVLTSVPDPLVAVMRRSHRLAYLKRITLAELKELDLTVPSPCTPARRGLDGAAQALQAPLHPMLETDSTQLRLSVAASSDSVAVVSRVVASQWEDSDDLVVVPIREKLLSRLHADIFASRLYELPFAAARFSAVLADELVLAAGGSPASRKDAGIKS